MSTQKSSELNLLKDRLRFLRGERTKAAFAREIGVSSPLYHQWEAGSKPTADKAALIAERCNVTVEWLLSGSGPPPNTGGSTDWSEQLKAATKLLHEKIESQERFIQSQRETIDSLKGHIATLEQRFQEREQFHAAMSKM